jgi:TonB-linked SusC/RagA family outer membrane protein
MKRLTFWLTCLLISINFAIAQNKPVSGTVVDEAGDPVIGASVVVKGNTSVGTVTDLNGKFTFSVPESATTLVVKYLGMEDQEVPVTVAAKAPILLRASDTRLDEVIVVAYGTAKRSQFTGSASVVKAEEIGRIQTTNLTNTLVGRVGGMQVANSSGQPGTTTPTVRVRGIGSINAGNAPLVIVDGIPYDGDLNNLNTQDIESITVLKDASSNALYGSRGANGVIMVTTKKGASGVATIVADAKWGANTRATQDYNFIKSPAQYYEMYYGALKSYFVNTLSYTPNDAHVLANQTMTLSGNDYGLGYNVYNVPTGQYLIGDNGKLNPNATLGNVVSYGGEEYSLLPDNWLDAAYKQSLRKEYNVTATAGTDRSSFFASFGYLDYDGITAKSDYKRLTGRLKADYQIKPWAKIGGNMSYTNYRANRLGEDGSFGSSGNIFAIATRIAPIYPLYIRDGQGKIKLDANGFQMYDYGEKGNAGLERPFLTQSNAVSSNLLDTYGLEGNAINASGFADITFLKDFKFTSLNTSVVDEMRETSVTNPYYGQYASSNGVVFKNHSRRFSYDFQQLLTYVKDVDVHHINVLVGHDYYRTQYFYLSADKSNMFDPNNHELNGAVTNGSPSSYTTDYNTEGFFSRAMYDYDNKYYGNLSYRRDASSRFHPDRRWGNFWSAGAAWDISKESFLANVNWIDLLKLKVSYGEQGNDNIGNYRYIDTYSIVNSNGRPAAVPSTKGNKDISWEKYGNFNTGIDFDLFNERLSGTVEYFYRKTSDMLFSFPLPPSFGWSSYFDNIGDMRNTGVEAELSGAVIKTKDLRWSLRVNFTTQNNKIIYLPEERKTMTTSEGVKGYSSTSYFYGEGQPLYTYYMKKYAGVNEEGVATYYKDEKDEDGKITGRVPVTNLSEATDYLAGTKLPDAFGVFGTSLDYKGIDLSGDLVYQLGGLVYDGDYASAMISPLRGSRGSAFHADLLNAWTPENKTSSIPRFQYGDQYTASTSDRFLTDASYLSLQNISLGYTIPIHLCKRLGLDKLRIYAVCDNVWLWSKRQGLDPRQKVDATETTSTYYAPVRSLSGGITLTF